MRKVVAIVGTNGSGKSTITRELISQNKVDEVRKNLVMISKNEKDAMFVGNYSPGATLPGCDRFSYASIYKVFNYALGNVTVIECQRFGHGRGLRDLALMCEQRNWELHIVWVQADIETCKKRVSKRTTVWKSGNIDQQFENIQKSFGTKATWTKVSNNNEVEKKEAVKKLTELIFN